MVIVSHDREFLDNLCTKIVETERGVATTYKVGQGQQQCRLVAEASDKL
jgi:ATP-binding cassette subfamily F protein 3